MPRNQDDSFMSNSSVQLARTELPIPVPSWDHYTSSHLFPNVGNGVHVCVDYRPHASLYRPIS